MFARREGAGLRGLCPTRFTEEGLLAAALTGGPVGEEDLDTRPAGEGQSDRVEAEAVTTAVAVRAVAAARCRDGGGVRCLCRREAEDILASADVEQEATAAESLAVAVGGVAAAIRAVTAAAATIAVAAAVALAMTSVAAVDVASAAAVAAIVAVTPVAVVGRERETSIAAARGGYWDVKPADKGWHRPSSGGRNSQRRSDGGGSIRLGGEGGCSTGRGSGRRGD